LDRDRTRVECGQRRQLGRADLGRLRDGRVLGSAASPEPGDDGDFREEDSGEAMSVTERVPPRAPSSFHLLAKPTGAVCHAPMRTMAGLLTEHPPRSCA